MKMLFFSIASLALTLGAHASQADASVAPAKSCTAISQDCPASSQKAQKASTVKTSECCADDAKAKVASKA